MTDDERKRYDDDVEFRNAACEHGSQRRKCNICELFCEQHDNAALRARIEVLEKAAEYAEHHPNCGYTFDHVTQTGELVGCTCGLEAALDAAKEGRDEEQH